MMKKIFIAIFIGFVFQIIIAQTYAKVNVVTLPAGMLNAGLETKLGKKTTIQAEVFVSPWKSFLGKRLQVYYTGVEGRYYFKESFKGFYAGANFGLAIFDIQKWNYLQSQNHQRGFTIMTGATIGYQYKINDRWNADIFIGGGNSQGFYHGYDLQTGERYEGSEPWNRSGEWLPFKGGLMLSYKIK